MSKILVDKVVLEQALEALEQSETFVSYEGFGMARREAERKHQAAITALRAALAEPAQEPVAWMSKADIEHPSGWRTVFLHTSAMPTENSVPLYTAPPQRKPLTEEELAND